MNIELRLLHNKKEVQISIYIPIQYFECTYIYIYIYIDIYIYIYIYII